MLMDCTVSLLYTASLNIVSKPYFIKFIVVFFSPSEKEYLYHLKLVMIKLKEAMLYIKIMKFFFYWF